VHKKYTKLPAAPKDGSKKTELAREAGPSNIFGAAMSH
jgi:hypothetical protein